MKERGMETRRDRKRSLAGICVLALLASVCTYILLIGMEKRALSDYEKEKVWVANKEILPNTTIRVENVGDLFKQVEMDRNQIPRSAIKNLEDLYGKRTMLTLNGGMVLCESMFTGGANLMEGTKNPVIVGWKAEDLSLAVNGVLRAGDLVNVYVYEKEKGMGTCLWQEVLVYQVFDSVGNEIVSEDKEGVAIRINLLLEEKEVAEFYQEMENSGILLVLNKKQY